MSRAIRRKRQRQLSKPPARPSLLERQLATLRRFRAVEPGCAFLWPEEARIVHSVIDHTYGLTAEQVPDDYIRALGRWEHHTNMIEQSIEEA